MVFLQRLCHSTLTSFSLVEVVNGKPCDICALARLCNILAMISQFGEIPSFHLLQFLLYSNRLWDGLVKSWRRSLLKWNEVWFCPALGRKA